MKPCHIKCPYFCKLHILDFLTLLLWHLNLVWWIGFLHQLPSVLWYITLSSAWRRWEVKPYRSTGQWRTGPQTHYQTGWSLAQGFSPCLKMRRSTIFGNKHNGGWCLKPPWRFSSESERKFTVPCVIALMTQIAV